MSKFFDILKRLYGASAVPTVAAAPTAIIAATGVHQYYHFIPGGIFLLGISYALHQSRRVQKSLDPYVELPYSVCIGKSRDEFESAIVLQERQINRQKIAWNHVKSVMKIHKHDWTFHSAKLLPKDNMDEWAAMTAAVSNHFSMLIRRLEAPAIFHIFLICPPTIAAILGSTIGRHKPCVVYQYAGNTKDPYTIIFDSSKRIAGDAFHAKTARLPSGLFEKIQLQHESCPGASTSIIIIDMTSHPVLRPLPEESRDGGVSVLTISPIAPDGHIPLGADWEQLGREISSAIFKEAGDNKEVFLYLNVPLALAFVIGTILGEPSNVTLCKVNAYHKTHITTLHLGRSFHPFMT